MGSQVASSITSNCLYISHLLTRAICTAHLILLLFEHPNNIWWSTNCAVPHYVTAYSTTKCTPLTRDISTTTLLNNAVSNVLCNRGKIFKELRKN